MTALVTKKGEAFMKVRPHKVNEAMRVFSEPRFQVDTLKVEIPVNMNFVEGFGDKTVMTQAEAAEAFKAQDAATNIPYIYLSGGVSAQLFMDSLNLQLIMVHISTVFYVVVQHGKVQQPHL